MTPPSPPRIPTNPRQRSLSQGRDAHSSPITFVPLCLFAEAHGARNRSPGVRHIWQLVCRAPCNYLPSNEYVEVLRPGSRLIGPHRVLLVCNPSKSAFRCPRSYPSIQLVASQELYDLVHFHPNYRPFQTKTSGPILAKRSPQLTNGHGLGDSADHKPVDSVTLSSNSLLRARTIQNNRTWEIASPK